jgi:DNA-binding MarR family transcriptional regulator
MAKEVEIDIGILLNVAFGVFKRDLHRHLSGRGFDDVGPSFGYVFRLLGREAHNLQGIAAALGITAQGALKIVNDMVEKGYVKRRDDPDDGRVKWLELTDRAREAMAQARRFHQQYERGLVRRLGEAQVSAMRAVLEDIHEIAQAEGLADIRPL